MLRILLLGGTGRLGAAVLHAARMRLDVAVNAPTRRELDLAQLTPERAAEIVDPHLVDAVINCAAAAHVDACETKRDWATALNVDAPGTVAAACAAANVPFLHVSTDYVFGDLPGAPYAEDGPIAPVQFYGETKAEGERRVLDASGRATVVRVSWLFGPDARPFERFVLSQRDDPEVAVMARQASRPTWIPGLAEWLLAVAGALHEGAFAPRFLHPAGGPHATRGEWARQILDARGLDQPVVDQGMAPPGLAPRPSDTRLDSSRTDDWVQATWASAFPNQRSAPSILDWREAVKQLAKDHP